MYVVRNAGSARSRNTKKITLNFFKVGVKPSNKESGSKGRDHLESSHF